MTDPNLKVLEHLNVELTCNCYFAVFLKHKYLCVQQEPCVLFINSKSTKPLHERILRAITDHMIPARSELVVHGASYNGYDNLGYINISYDGISEDLTIQCVNRAV